MLKIQPWTKPYSERFAGRKPKVFVGFVAYGDVDPGVFHSTFFWGVQVGARYHDRFELFSDVAQKREQYRARNALVTLALQAGADFLLMLDDDHTIGDCPEMLDEFYRAEKPVQGGLYMQRRGDTVQPVIQKYDPVRNTSEWVTEMPTESGPVDVLGGGVNWFDMTVFHFMAQPFWWPDAEERRVYFRPHQRFGLDVKFCIDVKEQLEIQPWLNMGVQVGHAQAERVVVRPPTMKGRTLCDACDTFMEWQENHWYCQTCHERGGDGGETHLMRAEDFAHREAFRPGYKQLAQALCDNFEFADVLDLGSGQGFLVDELLLQKKAVRGIELQADAVPFMSDQARAVIEIGDLTNGSAPTGSYGLVTCVEVAEHVVESKAEAVVDACANTATTFVYFTADDTHSRVHVNPQPRGYWIEKFQRRGFCYDVGKTEAIQAALAGTPCPWLQKNSMVFRRETNA
jgi:SAM-dependent methyltransferase